MSSSNIGNLSGSQTLTGSVSGADLSDSYQFTLSNPGNLRLRLDGLSTNVNLQLFNSAGVALRSSSASHTTAESIEANGLAAGTYYAKATGIEGSTNYKINLTADYAGNTRDSAWKSPTALTLSENRSFRDFVSTTDPSDYYQFNLTRAGSLNVELAGLGANADLKIFNSSGVAIGSSSQSGSNPEAVNLQGLSVGTYYAQVKQVSGSTNYTLKASTKYARNLLYVDNQNLLAADTNPGTEALPLKSLARAAKIAKNQSNNDISTKVVIAPGVYRETFDLWKTEPTTAPITLEAKEPGKVVISGSDIWKGWQPDLQNSSVYTHSWSSDSGLSPIPEGWDPVKSKLENNPITRHTEMIFVNDQPLKQVLSRGEVTEGTFYVSEDLNKVYIQPSAGTNMSTATVEVAVRPNLLRASGQNIALKGLVFEHSNSPINGGAVKFSRSSNVLIENSQFRHNNWDGLQFYKTQNLTVQNSSANKNGHTGMTGHTLTNFLFEGAETSYNNWRGIAGNYHDWSPGQKFMDSRTGTFRRFKSVGNQSVGLWFDTDNVNVTVEDSFFSKNLVNGIKIEANQGPIAIKNSKVIGNGGDSSRMRQEGILALSSSRVTLDGNTIRNNGSTQIRTIGEIGGRQFTNIDTQQKITVKTQDWKITNNAIGGTTADQLSLYAWIPDEDMNAFLSTLTSNKNIWSNPVRKDVFRLRKDQLTLSQWQAKSGEDQDSTWK